MQIENLKDRLARDESGAALVEYSILIGLITVATVGLISTVGTYVKADWTSLSTAMAPAA
jgi:pilus assembly protein Flp/PilA